MKFLADIGISQKTVNWLRKNGHDAIHLREQGLQRLPDDKILKKVVEAERIKLIRNPDFRLIAKNHFAIFNCA